MADSVADNIRREVEVELAHQVGAVRLGGLDADAEHFGDPLGGLALGNKLDDLALARPQSLQRLVDNLLAPQLPWRAMLARFMMNAARDDYSFQRPSRRETTSLLPRLASQSVSVVVALDTSGSVS